MNAVVVTLLLIAVVAVAFYLRLKFSISNSVNTVKKAPEVIPEDSVQCFSCGMVVPREKALEKKGRYFCGVKRNDRDGNPIGEKSGKNESEVP
ncbi:MAG: hypothetical protein OQK94_05305 [Gammaproteobacteria bacterium]|nr:hypothetical protein [Gammaproteobacteria bacterium]MCW8840144.1 hypothetical protein [Gammaproteobacteria bacterium]MCW8928312.1 hypothetical protein [Gammaproteobacteria bacterium]MCW8957500.1 hypothetical protein [Gammaproteobacteria bacterium]MCW8972002.1 hypothetical protein [Gammaproteobacteria bacterium]